MAPELLRPDKFDLSKGVPSKEADVYALGMTVYQVLTGRWPFFPKREVEVGLAVISGQRPLKPENAEEIGMTEVLWNLMERCWRADRATRPPTTEVLREFYEITGENKTTDTFGGSTTRLSTGNRSSLVSSLTTSREWSRLCLRLNSMATNKPGAMRRFSFPWLGYR